MCRVELGHSGARTPLFPDVKRHQQELIETFGISRHGVPSYSTIRRVMMGVDFDKLVARFNDWAKIYVDLQEEEWCGMDGKSIKGTVENHDSCSQNFVSIVSVFASKRGLVVGMQKFENKKKSEVRIVQELVTTLDLTSVVFTFDSLHCQKADAIALRSPQRALHQANL